MSKKIFLSRPFLRQFQPLTLQPSPDVEDTLKMTDSDVQSLANDIIIGFYAKAQGIAVQITGSTKSSNPVPIIMGGGLFLLLLGGGVGYWYVNQEQPVKDTSD